MLPADLGGTSDAVIASCSCSNVLSGGSRDSVSALPVDVMWPYSVTVLGSCDDVLTGGSGDFVFMLLVNVM